MESESNNTKEKKTSAYIKTAIRLVLTVAGIILGVWLVIKLGIYFLPFVIGWLIALVAGPMVRFLENRLKIKPGIGSVITTVTVLILVCLIIYFAGTAILKRGAAVISELPDYYQSVLEDLQNTGDKLGDLSGIIPEGLKAAIAGGLENVEQSIGNVLTGFGEMAIDIAGKAAQKLPYVFICVIVVIFSAYYFMSERDYLKKGMHTLFPGTVGEKIRFIGRELKKGVGGYFKAQLIIMAVIFAILMVAFLIMKVTFGPLWAFLIALLDFLPFFGTGFVLIPWAAVKVLNGSYRIAIILCALYIICLVVHQMLQPKLLSDKMEINPLLTLLFLFVGYKVGGVIGIFIGLLIGMVIVNLYKAGTWNRLIGDCKFLAQGVRDALK